MDLRNRNRRYVHPEKETFGPLQTDPRFRPLENGFDPEFKTQWGTRQVHFHPGGRDGSQKLKRSGQRQRVRGRISRLQKTQ